MRSGSLLLFGCIPVLLAAAGFIYQRVGAAYDRRRYRPPGTLVRAARRGLHVLRSGPPGRPAVLLEAGIAASSLSWTAVQRSLAVFAPVISYDRAGLGWSEASSGKLSLATMVRDLETVLNSTGLKTPYILVGHSFGTVVIRAFAFTHPGSVAGLVMVDPVSLESWARTTAADLRRLAVGVRLSRRGAVLAKWGVVRAALALAVSGSRRIPRLINQASSSKGSAVVERLLGEVRKMPQETWPLIQAHWSNPKSFRAMAAHLQCLPEAVRAAQEMPIDNSIPTIILSAASATASELSERDRWLNSHPLSRHVHVSETGHWLHLEQPELVVETVRELIGNVSSPVR